ncbi:replication protein A 32 kDa subunit B [Morus notabilis]|uniref:replication protein A 32 kDa subunit B n=1 Tax=Morus notabilis TaxID=981085 RepID=UPI000CED63F6|nr:replication protein A 32 kDa subunit B [Morus notabilis]
MYGSQFDGAAAFSGGGFMPSEATQTPDTSFSPAKNRDVQALLPLTVKQINDAIMPGNEKSEFLIDGVDVNNVKLVGIICDRVGRVSDVTFMLDDGTGRIDCNKWFHEAVDANEMEGILDGMYVCAHGRLKSFQGKRSLNVFSIRPVEDYNEIASHFIECIYVHVYNNRSRKLHGGANTQPQVTNPINQSFGQSNTDASKSIEEKVLDFLHHPMCLAREEGASIDYIINQLKIPHDKITIAIENLVREGNVYSTVDDNHFKSAING